MKPTVRQIIEFAACQSRVSVRDILEPGRHRQIARVRHRAMWAARKLRPDFGWNRLGHQFERDHTTVIHGYRAIEAVRAVDLAERNLCDAIIANFAPQIALDALRADLVNGAAQLNTAFQRFACQVGNAVRHVP